MTIVENHGSYWGSESFDSSMDTTGSSFSSTSSNPWTPSSSIGFIGDCSSMASASFADGLPHMPTTSCSQNPSYPTTSCTQDPSYLAITQQMLEYSIPQAPAYIQPPFQDVSQPMDFYGNSVDQMTLDTQSMMEDPPGLLYDQFSSPLAPDPSPKTMTPSKMLNSQMQELEFTPTSSTDGSPIIYDNSGGVRQEYQQEFLFPTPKTKSWSPCGGFPIGDSNSNIETASICAVNGDRRQDYYPEFSMPPRSSPEYFPGSPCPARTRGERVLKASSALQQEMGTKSRRSTKHHIPAAITNLPRSVFTCSIGGCSAAPKTFRRAEHLKRHQRTHAPAKSKTQCPYCTKTFDTWRQDNYRQHVSLHTKNKKGSRTKYNEAAVLEVESWRESKRQGKPLIPYHSMKTQVKREPRIDKARQRVQNLVDRTRTKMKTES